MKLVRFASDTKHRKQWFTGLSFSHPAKMSLPLQLWLIENFTKEGETILDPMAGSGTILVACSMGRNVICVELEQKFVEMMKGNWEKIQQRGAQMGYEMGAAVILQGDARNLTGIMADKCIFSPPYTTEPFADKAFMQREGKDRKVAMEHPNSIDHLPYGQVEKIITSPPYENSVEKTNPGASRGIRTRMIAEGKVPPACDYGATLDNIGNLRSASYLEAMLVVYQQCYSVLKDDGLMVLVTKNFIRNKQIVRLDLDTIKLCEQVGFLFQDRWYRELASQSFWRTIYYQKYPEVEPIKFEDVLVFGKEA